MKRKVKYWLPEHGQTVEDGYEVETDSDIPRWIAQDAADDYHSEHDGWESRWPLTIALQLEDGTQKQFEVECDYDPVFTAREKTA